MSSSDFSGDERPGTWSNKSQGSGVRRVNNVPLLIVGGVLAVFVILVVWVAFERAQPRQSQEAVETSSSIDTSLASSILQASGDRVGGLVDGEAEKALSLPIAEVSDLDLPPLPPRSNGVVPPVGDKSPVADSPLVAQLKAARLAMLQKAIQAHSQMDGAVAKSNQGVEPESAPGVDVRRRIGAEGPPGEGAADATEGGSASYAKFNRKGDADRWKLDSSVEVPRTPYELRAGFVIPATLLSGVNSELPGQLIAQVSHDVYDTATGKHRLIPQGTRLVGSYDSKVVYGQSRVLIAWQRLVFPDGKAMDIGSMPGADSAGYSGFHDKINNHYLRIFGSALLMSGVVAGVNSSQTNPKNDPFGTSTNTLLSQAVAQQLGQVAVEFIRKNINIAPTLEIRPGYRFNVMVVKDLTFDKPYQAFDY
jgi:type IV secretion system protein VirB10